MARLTTLISCFALACVTPTSPRTNGAVDAPRVFTEQDNHETESECPSLVGPLQSPFVGRLELQLPVGVVLTEQGPEQRVASEQTASCVGARTIARVMILEQPDDDPNLPISFVRDQLLDHLALPNGLKISTREADDAARRLTSVIAVPAQPEQGRERPTLILLALRGGSGRIYAVTFETSVEHFTALLPSLTASLDSLRILD